jgi:hypothetical protein
LPYYTGGYNQLTNLGNLNYGATNASQGYANNVGIITAINGSPSNTLILEVDSGTTYTSAKSINLTGETNGKV